MNKPTEISTEEVLESYVKEILEAEGTPIVAQGTSMQPVIEPSNFIYSAPLDRNYLIIGSIYAFQEGTRTIIKRLVAINEDVVHHGMKGTNYIFEGDNRETSLDKKVFVSSNQNIKDVFRRVVLYPNIPVSETLVKQLQGGNCMSNENLKNPQLSAESIAMIQSNEDLKNFVMDIRAVSHNTALRLYEMSCILDGLLNLLRANNFTNTDEIYNYINISTNLKEWKVSTGEYLQFEDFFAKFYPDLTLEDLKTAKHKREFQKEIDAFQKANSN